MYNPNIGPNLVKKPSYTINYGRINLFITLCLLSLALIAYYGHTPVTTDSALDTNFMAQKSFVSFKEAELSITNHYTRVKPITQNYRQVQFHAEPFKNTELSIGSADESLFDYTWELDIQHVGTVKVKGATVQHTFKSTGYVPFVVRKVSKVDGTEETRAAMLSVLYVRREVRDLTDDDRERFISTMHKLFTTSMAEGVSTYGDDFKNVHYFTQIHLQASAEKQCDHWHDGPAVVSTHLAISLEFEEALQLVDPSVALNYWDYTYDAYTYGGKFRQSEIFQNDWFGQAFPDSSDYTQTSGRWSKVELGTKQDLVGIFPEASIISNPFGLLRSPWNTQSTSKFTRFDETLGYDSKTLADCASFSSMYDSVSYSSLASLLNGGSHGPVHMAIGGNWGVNTDVYDTLEITYRNGMLLMSKNMWRMGFASCPSSCDSEEDCSCSCPSLDSASDEDKESVAYSILTESKSMGYLSQMTNYIELDSTTGIYTSVKGDVKWSDIAEALCEFGHVGEMYTSASPQDPLFWLIHPNVEKIYQWKLMTNADGYDSTWGYEVDEFLTNPSAVRMSCDWESALTESVSIMKKTGEPMYDETYSNEVWYDVFTEDGELYMPTCTFAWCEGMDEDDLLSTRFTGSWCDGICVDGQISHGDFLNLLDVDDYKMPYVYDDFTWEHCEAQGYYFEATA